MSMGPKMGHRNAFYISSYRENVIKIYLSETTRTKTLIFVMRHYLLDKYLEFVKLMPNGANNGPYPGVHIGLYKLIFSEYGHVAYQIKGDEAYNYILINVLSLHISLAPRRSKGHSFRFFK